MLLFRNSSGFWGLWLLGRLGKGEMEALREMILKEDKAVSGGV